MERYTAANMAIYNVKVLKGVCYFVKEGHPVISMMQQVAPLQEPDIAQENGTAWHRVSVPNFERCIKELAEIWTTERVFKRARLC